MTNKGIKITGYIAIISIGAFAGNMINIGLSYGIHWLSLEPLKFMESFAIDFPLLLYPTAVTLLPAFIATTILFLISSRGSKEKRFWSNAFIGLLVINVQTMAYHLPLNLQFMDQAIELNAVKGKLNTWLALHWFRVVVALASGVFALRGFTVQISRGN